MPTQNSWGNSVSAANVSFTGGTFIAGNDATDNAISIGTAANAGRTVTIGSGTAASSTVIDCGTGALNIGANAVAKTTTLGATTGASVLALKYGTGDFTLASATGTVMSALDTGEITYPLQPAFSANVSTSIANVTGDNTIYHIIADHEQFDKSSDYSTVTGNFTCPVDGIYYFEMQARMAGGTAINFSNHKIIPSSGIEHNHYRLWYGAVEANANISTLYELDAGDTVYCAVQITDTAGKVNDLLSDNNQLTTFFQGHLVC